VRAYSDIARGLPLITLIFFVYYAMPALKVNVSGWWAAVSALAAFETAHVAEVTRSSRCRSMFWARRFILSSTTRSPS
jgi:polar amino acid transport system permease protein